VARPARAHAGTVLPGPPTADVDVSGFDEFERAVLPEHRWWTLAELEDAAAGFGPDEALAPKELPRLLAAILAGQVPTDPVAIHHLPPRRERPG
jgi:hypothetical protein